MPFHSPLQCHVPDVSIATYLFKSPTAKLPDSPLFIDADKPDSHYLSFHTYRQWSQRLAVGLRKRGFKRGERVLIYSTNTIYYMVGIMGTIMAGGIFTGSNPAYTERELSHHLNDAKPSYVLIFPDGLERGHAAATNAGVPKDRIFVFDGSTSPLNKYNFEHWTALLASEQEAEGFAWDSCDTPETSRTTCALNYSSGTTGLPKGVEISHKNYVANMLQFGAEQSRRPDPIGDHSLHLCYLPLNHAMAQVMIAFGVPAWGGKVFVQVKFDFMEVMKAIGKFKINTLAMVPPVMVAMSKHPLLRSGKIDLSAVRSVQTGAAPISADTLNEFSTLFKNAERIYVRNGYGMSEGTCGITGGPYDANPGRIGSVGQLLANIEGKIMADDGKTEVTGRGSPQDDPPRGELWVKGPNVMNGYWRNQEATASTITPDGWLQTGDVCTITEDGYIYIVDRKKELIKVKGNQVAPAELEALLLEHPSIADAAVIGVPTEDGDEVPRAYVKLQDNETTTEKEIQEFVASRVSKNKRLMGGVKFSPEGIPKNPSGKILRKLLREQAAKEREPRAKL